MQIRQLIEAIDELIKTTKDWYSVEGKHRYRNGEFQEYIKRDEIMDFNSDYTRIDQFETLEEARECLSKISAENDIEKWAGFTIWKSTYEYDNEGNPHEIEDSIEFISWEELLAL